MARQEVTIGSETFEADVEMIPLLRELCAVGLRTTQHCIGHDGDGTAYLSIAIEPDMEIGIRYDERPRLIIRWNRVKEHKNDRSC